MAVVTCVVCAAATETGMACARCEARIDRQLSDIVEFYAIACGELLPGRGGDGRSGERGLGVRIDALDFVAGRPRSLVVYVLEQIDLLFAGTAERRIALFCYEPPALRALLLALAGGTEKTRLLVTAGRASAAVESRIFA